MQWLNSTGVAISAFFILFILSKRNRRRADYLLILINILMISFLILDLVARTQLTVWVFFLQSISPYLLFPVFLLYALEILQEKNRINRYWILLFAPAIISIIFLIGELFFLHTYDAVELQQLYDHPPFSYHILYKGNQLLFLAALIWLIKKLRDFGRNIKEQFSFIDPIELSWLTETTWAYLGTTVVSFLIFIVSNFQLLPLDIQMAYSVVSGCIVLAAFYTSFQGIRHFTVAEYYGRLSLDAGRKLHEPIASESPTKYKTSSLSGAEQDSIFQSLLSLFENQKVYLEPKLQLQEVADRLNVTTHHLSQTINSVSGKPFYDFVNSYRVKHLQNLLLDPTKRNLTILALGMDSGFNSKASLNRIFKDETGLSPKEYQQRNLRS
ncbi:MAG: helix-turn-helix domain-containing protein [Bacteroidota bacterium]|jgi:AraC-like DNA-binding protein|nr:AraC family transcriptional regulator [Cytophagales bacterium]MCE2958273.1 helix-turn-helix domain-containing protein [Flammeovirgaceae bacterium]MCZ8070973.1 helix-turn-helix domain-containing protein [Cytophagales bacterium]